MGKASLYKFAIFFDSKFLTIYDVDVDDDVGSNDGGGDATVDIIWCRPPPSLIRWHKSCFSWENDLSLSLDVLLERDFIREILFLEQR